MSSIVVLLMEDIQNIQISFKVDQCLEN